MGRDFFAGWGERLPVLFAESKGCKKGSGLLIREEGWNGGKGLVVSLSGGLVLRRGGGGKNIWGGVLEWVARQQGEHSAQKHIGRPGRFGEIGASERFGKEPYLWTGFYRRKKRAGCRMTRYKTDRSRGKGSWGFINSWGEKGTFSGGIVENTCRGRKEGVS